MAILQNSPFISGFPPQANPVQPFIGGPVSPGVLGGVTAKGQPQQGLIGAIGNNQPIQTPGQIRGLATSNAFNQAPVGAQTLMQERVTGGVKPTGQNFDPRSGGITQPQTIGAQEGPVSAQPQFGLAGSEQALMAGQGAGISALEQGQAGALNTLGLGQQLSQQQLGQGRDLLLGGAQAGVGQVQQGLGGALGQLGLGQQALGGNFGASAVNVDPNTGQPLFQQAAAGVGAFSPAGLQAQGLQSALSGAQGQEAFNQALINSPVQQFLREQGEQSRINQAAATGGLGGGEVQKELARFGQGLAGTQLQQQIQNLGALSGQGLQAAGQQGQFLSQAGQQQGNLASQNAQLGTQANLASAANRLQQAGQQANLFGQGAQAFQRAGETGANILGQATGQAANLFGQGAGLTGQFAGQGAGIQSGLGQQAANIFTGTGQNLAQGRTQAGRDLAGQIGQSTSALANLQQQQSSGVSDILGQGGSNIANLLSGAGQLTAQQQTQLAQLLSNLAVGEGSQIAGAQQGIGQAQAGGIQGRADALGGTITDAAKLAAFFSDKRLKKNIKKLTEKAGVNIYSWDWNGLLGLTGKAIGVLAQEVEKLIPNSVIETDTGYKAVNYKIVQEHINASI